METRIRWVHWLLALPLALLIAWLPVGCAPQPAATVRLPENTVDLMRQKQDEADRDAAAVAAIYANMSDEERMRGIVYEQEAGNGQ